jgi:hypothetical protein
MGISKDIFQFSTSECKKMRKNEGSTGGKMVKGLNRF